MKEQKDEIRILVVDDVLPTLSMISRLLQIAGYGADLAQGGRQAVDAYKAKRHNLILMDLEMPGMDGYGATKAIRDFERNTSRPDYPEPSNRGERAVIVAMTGYEEYREDCLKAGMDDYIAKPVRMEDLSKILKKWFLLDPGDESYVDPGKYKVEQDTPMDFERAVEEFEGDREFVMDVLLEFIAGSKIRVRTMGRALIDGDIQIVEKEAHAIKGAAANLTASSLASIAYELEEIARFGKLEGVSTILDRLKKELLHLEDYAQKGCTGC